jgi:beta-lactam-binding protein with PASTA domain
MSKKWFCQVADQEIGPISSGELKALAAEGKLGPEDLVRKDGQEGWATARQVNGLTFTTSANSPVTPSASTTTPVETVGPPRLPTQRPPAIRHGDRPSQTPGSTDEASMEPPPKANRTADEMKRVVSLWFRRSFLLSR